MLTWWQSEFGLLFLFAVNAGLIVWCLRVGRRFGMTPRPWKWWIVSGIAVLSGIEIQWLFWRVAGLLGLVSAGFVTHAPGGYGWLLWVAIAHGGLLVGFVLALWRMLHRAITRKATTAV